MGILDLLGGVLGRKKSSSTTTGAIPDLGPLGSILGGLGGNGGSVLTALLPLLAGGGLTEILGQLQGGHASKLASWVGTGPNDEIGADDVEQVLGSDQVAQIAAQSGVSHDEAKGQLAKLLPGVIDQLSPTGALPEGAGLEAALSSLSKLGR